MRPNTLDKKISVKDLNRPCLLHSEKYEHFRKSLQFMDKGLCMDLAYEWKSVLLLGNQRLDEPWGIRGGITELSRPGFSKTFVLVKN